MTKFSSGLDQKADVASNVRVPSGRLTAWSSTLVSWWTKWRDRRASRALLNSMTEAALGELGIKRVGRRVRWLDYGEAPPLDDFDYHVIVDDAAGRVPSQNSIKIDDCDV
ncbi:hypothetical protein [Mesorhizobium sp. KR2-14]|uniref:hypothetical protein n=1 Tax=Mesorhizobium sp. KR2-14 TaxID=3156610 RepID=UPI0032B48C2D